MIQFVFIKRSVGRGLLVKTFGKMLLRQAYLKLTKFTRRSSETREFLNKVGKGYEFIKCMSHYNRGAIKRSRLCLNSLVAGGIQEVSVYGAGDIAEILYDLTFEIPITIKTIYDDDGAKSFLGPEVRPVEESAAGKEQVIVASLVAIEEKVERLRSLGLDTKRIVLLT